MVAPVLGSGACPAWMARVANLGCDGLRDFMAERSTSS